MKAPALKPVGMAAQWSRRLRGLIGLLLVAALAGIPAAPDLFLLSKLGGRGRRILVLYQDARIGAGTRDAALLTANLAGHFGMAALQPIGEYRAGEARRFSAVIVLPSVMGPAPPAVLLADVRSASRPVIWIQHGAQALLLDPAYARSAGWRVSAPHSALISEVDYRGAAFPRDLRGAWQVSDPAITDPSRASVLAWAVAPDGARTPWAIRSGALTYVLEAPFAYTHEDDRYVAFADILMRALAPNTPERHRALLRIEDVGPEANPATVRRLVDLLSREGVPFSIATYDGYRDAFGHFNKGRPLAFGYAERPELVAALRYARDHGGTLVAHGHTHQAGRIANPYAGVSGGDFEFYRAQLDEARAVRLTGPLPQDGRAAWSARLAALEVAWSKAGLGRPAIFTTPHYAASPNAYAAIRARFPVRYERALYFPGGDVAGAPALPYAPVDEFFPYPVRDVRGDVIVPENLGYLAQKGGLSGGGRSPDQILASARRNLVVRDGFASFFVHWYGDTDALLKSVRGLKAMGYTFVTPRTVVADFGA